MIDRPASLEDRVTRLIAEHLDVEAFVWESELKRDLDADSLDKIELAMAIEGEFDVHVSDAHVERWHTAGDILNTVRGLV